MKYGKYKQIRASPVYYQTPEISDLTFKYPSLGSVKYWYYNCYTNEMKLSYMTSGRLEKKKHK